MGKAFVNVPINDKLAGSITVFGEHREGWYKLTAYGGETGGGLEDTLVRAKLRYAPTKDIDLILTGLVSRQLDRSQGMNETLYGNNNRLPAPGVFTAITPYDYAGNVKPYTDTMTQAASLRATVAAGPGHFTSTTAYQAVQSPLVTDSDNTNVAFQDNWQRPESRTISQEVLYTLENTGRLHGTTGVYYYNNKNSHLVNVNPGPGGLYAIDGGNVRHIHEHSEAWAVFGEFTYDVTSKLSLTGGLRYSRETRHGDAMQWVTTAGVTTLVNTLPPVEKTWSAWTPRVSAVYSFDERHNVYFTYSKGFKSGLFNVVGLQKAPVEPEDIRSYEVGSKNRFADFTFDVAAFYYDYRNLQVQSLIQIPPSISFVSLVNNAATSKIYGLEANLDWRVTSELSANAGLSLLHARYENYPTANATVPFSSPGVASCNFQSYTPFLVGGYKSLTCDASGKKMLRSPDATFDLAVNYEKETQVGTFDLSAIFYWTTTIYYDPIDYVKQPAYSTINAQVSFRPAGREHLKFSLFGTNLNDARYLESVQESTASILVRYAAPRQIGVKVGYSF
jgi:iron complex outermembrane receptor protein